MKANCADLERGLSEESPEWVALVEEHARGCASCAAELREWRGLSVAAEGLRKEWDAPALWPRIRDSLAEQSARPSLAARVAGVFQAAWSGWRQAMSPRLALVTVAVLALVVGGLVGRPVTTWISGSTSAPPDEWQTDQTLASYPILTERAVDEVESAERQYVAAIDRLSKLVKPQVAAASSPLVQSYREKLALLDSAIAELQAGISENERNAHLRRELLAMYREKQQTLRDLVRVSQP